MFNPLEQFHILSNESFPGISTALIVIAFVGLVLLSNGTNFLKNRFILRGCNYKPVFRSQFNISPIFYSLISSISITKDIIGSKKYFLVLLPILFTAHTFVLILNILGLSIFSLTLTSQFIIVFSISVALFILINIFGILKHGSHYSLIFLPGSIPLTLLMLLVPIETLSFFFRPVSLSIRLFSNLMAGHILLKVVFGFYLTFAHQANLWILLSLVSTAFLVILLLLELAVAFIQALIFTTLIAVYFREMIDLG